MGKLEVLSEILDNSMYTAINVLYNEISFYIYGKSKEITLMSISNKTVTKLLQNFMIVPESVIH